MAVGPIEQRLRARLNYGAGLTRVEVHAFGGDMARGILDRLCREGVAVLRDGRYTLASYQPDPAALALAEEERLQRFEARRAAQRATEERLQAAEAERGRLKAQREERARVTALLDGARTPEARELVVRRLKLEAFERAVLADLPAIAAAQEIDCSVFGIEMDNDQQER